MKGGRDMFAEGISRIVTVEFLAEVFGCSVSMIYKYQRAGMPKEARGRYDLAKCVQWYCQRARSEGMEGETERNVTDARTRLVDAQRIKTELETERLRGRLIDVHEVGAVLNELAGIVATQADALGPRLAGVLAEIDDPAMVQAEIASEARALRVAIADRIRRFADDGPEDSRAVTDDSEDRTPAAVANG